MPCRSVGRNWFRDWAPVIYNVEFLFWQTLDQGAFRTLPSARRCRGQIDHYWLVTSLVPPIHDCWATLLEPQTFKEWGEFSIDSVRPDQPLEP